MYSWRLIISIPSFTSFYSHSQLSILIKKLTLWFVFSIASMLGIITTIILTGIVVLLQILPILGWILITEASNQCHSQGSVNQWMVCILKNKIISRPFDHNKWKALSNCSSEPIRSLTNRCIWIGTPHYMVFWKKETDLNFCT